MEKSIYEQLNEIDDNESLQEESAKAKLKRAFPELNFGDDSDNNSVEDSEPKTMDQAARSIDQEEITTTPKNNTPLPDDIKKLVNACGSYEDAIKLLGDELAKAAKEVEIRTGKTTRERLRDLGYNV